MTPFITTNRQMLDMAKVVAWTKSLPGGARLSKDDIERSHKGSILFGVYLRDATENDDGTRTTRDVQQVGFARVVSDTTTFSAITDVYISESVRRIGLGSLLMLSIVAHGAVKRTICVLNCREELFPFYARFNFIPTGGPWLTRNP